MLAVQGSFEEHAQVLKGLVEEVRLVRAVKDLHGLQGLVIPGGESTTIGRFLDSGLRGGIRDGLPLFGTCAGLIVLAKGIAGGAKEGQPLLKRMDIEVERNAYGRQRESFEDEVRLTWDERPFRGVFIRAPRIVSHGPDVDVLGVQGDEPVLVRQGVNLACTFHPELVDDERLHRYFIEEVVKDDE